MKRKAIDVHIYFPPEVSKNIKILAALQRRSVSAQIVMAVEEHLERNKPTLLLAGIKVPRRNQT